jgi:hypothetical protein
LREQIADDITELEIARDQGERVSALTAAAVQRRLGTAQQQLLLIQASVVGSILMVLAAVQAFGTELPIPDSLQTPLIAVLGSLALALPTAVLRWSRSVRHNLPLGGVDYLFAFLTGVSIGWLTTTAIGQLGYGHIPDRAWTVPVSLGCGLIAIGLARLRTWFLSRHAPDAPGQRT